MKWNSIFGILVDIRQAIKVAFFPTLKALFQSPLLLFRPLTLSRLFMSHVWGFFAVHVDEGGKLEKQKLIPSHAYGVVLDIGAAHGHTVHYLDRSRVRKYIALEPNKYMHDELRKTANAGGYSEEEGTLLVLGCGAEDIRTINSATEGPETVDTIISILTLCSIPSPKQVIKALATDVLKPGGTFLFYEHVKSPLPEVVRWQNFWTPLWRQLFDGCSLNRPTELYVRQAGVWSLEEEWLKEGEDVENLFWHRAGRFVKENAHI